MGYSCEATLYGSEGQLHLDDRSIRLQTRSANAEGKEPRTLQPQAPDVGTWSAFAEALETREPALTDSGDNLNSLAMLFAAVESAETGQIAEPVRAFSTLV